MTINAVYCTDDNYVMPAMVSMASLKANNPECNIQIHLIGDKLSEQTCKKCKEFASSINVTLFIYNTDTKLLSDNFPEMPDHISLATFLRCFITDFLPSTLDKVFYFDCDMLILGSLKELLGEPLYGVSVLAAEETDAIANAKRLGYPIEYSYFNAGFLVINLDYWRKINLKQQTLDFLVKNPDKLLFHDQDVLNALLHSTKKMVSIKYNMQDPFYRRAPKLRPGFMEEAEPWIWKPVVLHFTGRHKPWKYKTTHPMKFEFEKYLEMTPYKGWKPQRTFLEILEVHINKFLEKIHLHKDRFRKYI